VANSPEGCRGLDEYGERLGAVADVLKGTSCSKRPRRGRGELAAALPELLRAARVGGRLRKLDMSLAAELLSLLRTSAATISMAGLKAIRQGAYGSTASSVTSEPYTPGSAYVLLHHVFGEVNGKKARGATPSGEWAHHPGDGEISGGARRRYPVSLLFGSFIVEGDRAVGVVTKAGKRSCRRRHLNLNRSCCIWGAVRFSGLPHEFRERIAHWPAGSGTFRNECRVCPAADSRACPARRPPITTPRASSSRRPFLHGAGVFDARSSAGPQADRRSRDPVDTR